MRKKRSFTPVKISPFKEQKKFRKSFTSQLMDELKTDSLTKNNEVLYSKKLANERLRSRLEKQKTEGRPKSRERRTSRLGEYAKRKKQKKMSMVSALTHQATIHTTALDNKVSTQQSIAKQKLETRKTVRKKKGGGTVF